MKLKRITISSFRLIRKEYSEHMLPTIYGEVNITTTYFNYFKTIRTVPVRREMFKDWYFQGVKCSFNELNSLSLMIDDLYHNYIVDREKLNFSC